MTPTPLQPTVVRARRHGIADLLARSAARTPDKTAVVFGDVRQSFAALDTLVSRTAGGLAARGVAKGDRIVLLARNSHGFAVAYFALARLGAVSVPVNCMLTPPEVAYVLDHSGAVGVIAGADLAATADAALTEADLAEDALKVHAVIGEAPGWEPFAGLGESAAPCPDVGLGDDDPVQIMYTSGTESRPKGAVMTSRNLTAQYTTAIVDGGMTADDVEIHALPLYHCAQLHCFLTPDIPVAALARSSRSAGTRAIPAA